MSGLFGLVDFVRESNRIEGILREPTPEEVVAHTRLLARKKLAVEDVCEFVKVCAGERHVLRDRVGLNVRVGNHIPPPGGPEVRTELAAILGAALLGRQPWFAWMTHVAYETLHPFTDGNGRSGRAIWLWQMGGNAPLGFLHHFYYQTLENAPTRAASSRGEG